MSFGDDLTPESSGEGLQVAKFDHCLHTVMVIGKCEDVFRGFSWRRGGGGVEGGGYVGGYFDGEIYNEGRECP